MLNRQPTPGKEGRVHIVPENGDPDYYARIEMADDPLEPGTQFVKETMLQDDTAQAYNLNGKTATPDDVFKRQIISTDIKSLCGLSSAATLNDVIQRLAIGFGKYLWTVKVLDQDGTPIPNVLVHADGQEGDYPSVVSVTDENGVAQVVAPSPAKIGVNDWFDYQKTSEEFTASGLSFNQSVTLSLARKTSAYELITESGEKIFSPMLASADITAVGGGASGGSPYYEDHGAGGGAGGEIKTLKKYDMKKGSETTLSITVGEGGESVGISAGGQKSGIAGGATTVKNGESTILSAAGGTGGNAGNGASGGTSSNGGYGGPAGSSADGDEDAGDGGPATANIFDDPSVGKLASGGGGGTGYNRGANGAGGTPNGGAGGGTEYGDGEDGKLPGGGGGAGSNRRSSGAGADGGVYMRFYWE